MTHTPRKRFGQHFLVDRSVLAAIADAVAPSPRDRVVEIGPGLGALTAALLERVPSLDAVEIDRDLIVTLRRRFGERLRLHEADALAFDFGALAAGGPMRLVGNLPYNISSPLLVRLLRHAPQTLDQHFMLQKEVVERIVAEPGGRDFGRLSVMMQAHHDVESLFDVPPEAFDPPPKVESAVLRLLPRPTPMCRDRDALERVLTAAFGQRRKMIRNTLLPWLAQHGVDVEDLGDTLAPTARAEEVDVATWCTIADRLAATR